MQHISGMVNVSDKLGTVSTLLYKADDARYFMVLGHGAGAGMHHPFMEELAKALAHESITTLRYQFPYIEQGRKRPDFPATTHLTIEKVLESLAGEIDIPIILAGKSFGGRMASQYIAKHNDSLVRALVFYGFPLHSPAKPGSDRADHLQDIDIPMLFLQGDRDVLAKLDLLIPVINSHIHATLDVLEGGDHSFKCLKKSGISQEAAIMQLAKRTRSFLDTVLIKQV